MEQYIVTGMSCAACQARVEKAVSAVPGVDRVAVNLLTNTMAVDGKASVAEVLAAVEQAGYGAVNKGSMDAPETDVLNVQEKEEANLKKRLVASVLLLIPLMYLSMGYMMWHFPVPQALETNHLALGLILFILTSIVMLINQRFFISGFNGLLHRAPNMDTLVALGASAAYLYSIYALFGMTAAVTVGNHAQAMEYMDAFYFESAATILTLITVGKMLEAKSKGKTTDALKGLMQLAPQTAVLLKDGREEVVTIDAVKPGDVFVLKAGERIPVDGVVRKGFGAFDESALTGESLPVDKKEGDEVYAATNLVSGYLECEALKVGEDTTLSKIIAMVSDASATKAPIAKVADRVSGVFVPIVIGIAVVTFLVWMFCGADFGFSLSRAICVLVISCPCALGLATPVAIMVGNGVAAKNKILFKTAVSLEETGKVNILALDKTGTITEGRPEVRRILPANIRFYQNDQSNNTQIYNEDLTYNLLRIAASLEKKSEHPLGLAVLRAAEEKGLCLLETADFETVTGSGVKATINGKVYAAGNRSFVEPFAPIEKQYIDQIEELSKEGMTPLLFAEDGVFLGMIGVADVIKEDTKEAIFSLKKMGMRIVMLTGDNRQTAETVAAEAGVDEVFAGLLPGDKEAVIRKLGEKGKVAMVGDGINDAPALVRADVGIAIGAGADVAVDAADVVLIRSSLADVVGAVRISKAALRNIHENLFWAFIYNIIGIPLAAGVWMPLFGWSLSPMFAAAAMSLSSFCVVTNALRLNFIKVIDCENQTSMTDATIEEGKEMTIEVKGMMCAHCEAHTKEALEKIDGVISATADHATDTVVIETEKEVPEDALKQAVEGAGYEYVGRR